MVESYRNIKIIIWKKIKINLMMKILNNSDFIINIKLFIYLYKYKLLIYLKIKIKINILLENFIKKIYF